MSGEVIILNRILKRTTLEYFKSIKLCASNLRLCLTFT